MKLTNPEWWDAYSDQPYRIPKLSRRKLGVYGINEYFRTALLAAALSPIIFWRFLNLRRNPKEGIEQPLSFIGLGVSPDKDFDNQTVEMVNELGVKHLLIRVPTWHADYLATYLRFAERFPEHHLLINILQSRESIENPSQWEKNVSSIIDAFLPITNEFQIGNAINRVKWGCRHTGEYLDLLKSLGSLREMYPGIVLAGSSVIDFEPLATLATLVNLRSFQLDACSALLYVNRRGSPYSGQYRVFDLENKIRLIYSILSLSPRCSDRLWITETNWPLLDTKPWTPNSGHPRSTVDEKTQADYLTDYYQIAFRTGMVERVYWWQLINPGYGLVDHRSGKLRKMPSYFALKDLLHGRIALNRRRPD